MCRRRVTSRAVVSLVAALAAGGCTKQLYEGAPLPPEHVAVIHVGTALVREIDGQRRRGGYFDVSRYEVPPGTHRLTLVYALPARVIGPKTLPAQAGEGTCELVFATDAGRQYYLGARALGEPMSPHWNGRWEAWVRDPSSAEADDVVARCTSEPSAEEGADTHRTPAPAAAPVAAALPAASTPAIAGAAASPTPTRTVLPPSIDSVRLGTWNVRGLGRGEKDYAELATAIDQHFDVLTLTEVLRTSDGGHAGYDRLLAALGDGWAGLVTAAPDRAGGEAEYPAVLYRRDRVRPCAGWEALRFADGGAAPATSFLHQPAFACFEAGAPGSTGVDFLLGTYHAAWADGDAAAISGEVAQLAGVFNAMRLSRPGEDDLIIAGDFHLESVELPPIDHASDHTRGEGSTLNLHGDRTHDLTDHILVYDDRATREMLGDADVLDVRGVAPSQGDFYRTVSDHLPIMVRLRATGPDDD